MPATNNPLPQPPAVPGPAEKISVLVVTADDERWERVAKALPPEFTCCVVRDAVAARTCFEKTRGGLLVCDLELFAQIEDLLGVPHQSPGELPLILLAAPGSEEEAAEVLRRRPAVVAVTSPGFESLLPALIGQVAKAQQELGDFGQFLRHEINNPLTGVLVNAELLLESTPPLPDPAVKRLRTIVELSVALRGLVRSIEDRIPAGLTAPPDGEARD